MCVVFVLIWVGGNIFLRIFNVWDKVFLRSGFMRGERVLVGEIIDRWEVGMMVVIVFWKFLVVISMELIFISSFFVLL